MPFAKIAQMVLLQIRKILKWHLHCLSEPLVQIQNYNHF